jgi:hypothetical protein
MTDIIVKIMVELLSVLSLATKQIKQGRLSKRTVILQNVRRSLYYREVCKEAVRGERGRGHSPTTRPLDAGRGSDDCCTDLGRGARSCQQYESSYGRWEIIA